jgi:hypothetical protein
MITVARRGRAVHSAESTAHVTTGARDVVTPWRDNITRDVRTISDTPYRVAVVARLYCIGLIQPRDSFGLSSL